MPTLYLSPAYGRTYRTSEAMYDDWKAGKDFKGEGGYTSINEIDTLRDMGYKQILISQDGWRHVGFAI